MLGKRDFGRLARRAQSLGLGEDVEAKPARIFMRRCGRGAHGGIDVAEVADESRLVEGGDSAAARVVPIDRTNHEFAGGEVDRGIVFDDRDGTRRRNVERAVDDGLRCGGLFMVRDVALRRRSRNANCGNERHDDEDADQFH